MNSEYLVELDRVDKVFTTKHFFQRDDDTQARRFFHKKRVHAARSISLGVRPGEIFGLLGPNGAGKTTTVKMISGLVRPDSGAAYVAGLHVERKRLQVLRKVGVVLEGTRTSIWPLTPYENLVYYGNLKNVRGAVLKQRAQELLAFIGLKEKTHVEVRKLSRGQKQKLAVCIALIADPEVILLDEPTTGLDVQSSRSIKDKIRELTRTQGRCVLVTTHDMHVAQEICDRIGIINEGRLVACKRTEELLELFSDQSFEFHVDRLPAAGDFDGLPGVHQITPVMDAAGPMLVARMAAAREERSKALYATMARLREHGYVLRTIVERQPTLERVFLRLTSRQHEDQMREADA